MTREEMVRAHGRWQFYAGYCAGVAAAAILYPDDPSWLTVAAFAAACLACAYRAKGFAEDC